MGRRIEVELTSTRDDGSWTWRAAGARQPKGELGGSLLYDGAKVGDVVKVEAEFHVDGIEVTEVFAPKEKKQRTDLLEMKSRQYRDDELVTTQRVSRDDRRGGNRRNRRGDRDDRRRGRGEGRGDRGPRQEVEARPKPKRLRPRRTHREALLAEVGDEHRPIVEQVIKDGMPGVRAAIEKQNAEAKEAGKPEIDAAPVLAIAEKNLHKARLAEWRDRADAAMADADELDLRDLRSVVVSGNDVARDDESREIAEKLKTALDARVESDHANWLADMESAINDGRVVRALRLSSRPVKAGAPLPPELATKLAGQASEALAADVGQERWATVLDALAYSPVRGAVTPAGMPAEPKNDLIDAVKRLSDRIPTIAELFGVDPASVPRSAKRRRPRRDGGPNKGKGQGQGAKQGGSGKDRQPRSKAADGPKGDAPKSEAPKGDTPTADAAPTQPGAEAAPATETGSAADAPEADTEAPAPEATASEAEAPAPEADAAPAPESSAGQAPEAAPAPESAAPEAEAAAPVADPPTPEPVAEAESESAAPVADAPAAEPETNSAAPAAAAPAETAAPAVEPEAAAPLADASTPEPEAKPVAESEPAAEPAAAAAPEAGATSEAEAGAETPADGSSEQITS